MSKPTSFELPPSLKPITIQFMRIYPVFLLIAVLLFPVSGDSANVPVLPDSIGSTPVLIRVDLAKTWDPDNMYEHVNGEAELLKRYGALNLTYVSYESEEGDRLAVDILDMGAPVNAYGLYSLYAGCDGEEYSASGATVLSGDFTSYAILGRRFMRIDFETKGGSEEGKSLVNTFLAEFSGGLSATEPLPAVIEHLKKLAGKPCEVGYHPEQVDYDLEAGPGYTWTGSDASVYFISFLSSPDQAETCAASLKSKSVPTVLAWRNVVSWSKEGTKETADYLKAVVKKAAEW